ncbi:MAG TPA: helix-turn-helix domain-containing protein [Opitutaceae bacterium]
MNTEPDPAALPELATKEQVARFLQVSKTTVDRMRRRGVLPSQKLGALVRFPAAKVREAIAGIETK